MELTENKLAELDTAALTKKAQAIRDAVMAKSVTAEQVGSLFVDLIGACGNVRDALALFLDTNVPEITADIDSRLAGADAATLAATAAAQKAEATRALVEELVGKLSSQNLSKPVRLEVKAPGEKPRALQVSRHKLLAKLGFPIYILDGVEQIGGILDEIQAT